MIRNVCFKNGFFRELLSPAESKSISLNSEYHPLRAHKSVLATAPHKAALKALN